MRLAAKIRMPCIERAIRKPAQAVDSGLFDPELVPIVVEVTELNSDEKPLKKSSTVKRE